MGQALNGETILRYWVVVVFFTFCIVIEVEVEEIVVVVVEVQVMEEEWVVLQRGPQLFAPLEQNSIVVLVALRSQITPTPPWVFQVEVLVLPVLPLWVCSPWSEERSGEILVGFEPVCRVFRGGVSCWVQKVKPPLVGGLTARLIRWSSCFRQDFLVASLGLTRVSVRNMVPTLTSSKRRGLSLNGRC
jgi:hypothetical protein